MSKNTLICNTDSCNAPFSDNDKVHLQKIRSEEFVTKSLFDSVDSSTEIYNIPVVFHIVYKNPVQNIEESQIHMQIESLNKDFRNKNIDNAIFSEYPREKALAADSFINFYIAKFDHHGNATNGITRTPSNIKFSGSLRESGLHQLKEQPIKSTKLGGHDAWDTTKYLNIWICELSSPGAYAQYPRANLDNSLLATDGVVIDYRVFGIGGSTYPDRNKGKTLTHEVGHWLGLYHLWGPSDDSGCETDGDCHNTGDEICDTPPQLGPHCGSPKNYSGSLKCPDAEDDPIFLNFMDDWDDEYSLMFTKGQITRMRSSLREFRKTLISNN